ncbi:MAG TPA: M48 family metalloprotease, partial [Sphingomicrobium sp.]|nr:M48 family metalloprotease [Sphingomicrobium sp.]
MCKAVLYFTAAAVVGVSSAVTAQYGVRTIDPRYVAEAQRQHPQFIAEFGGADTGPRAGYVNAVGQRVAAQTGLYNPGATFRFTVLNSAVENALTNPGGYVYITRQLMALMNDESELAFALAHEAAHVAANHAQQREAILRRNSQSAWAARILGSIIGGSFGNAIAQRSQLSAVLQTLSFSREQEHQSDALGIRYLVGAGYDPAGSTGILAAIGRATALEARVQGQTNRQIPEWASTHPLNENRIRRTTAEARATGRLGSGIRNRDQFLAQLEGVYVDDDPEQGVIDGRTFAHPDLGMHFTVPVGYLMQNGTREVSIGGSAGRAEFSGGGFIGPIEAYVNAVLGELTRQQVHPSQIQRRVINGIPAAIATTRVQTRSGLMDASVVAYQWDRDTLYHFVTVSRGGTGLGAFWPMVQSLRRLSPAERSAIRPRVIDVVTVAPGDTVTSLASRMAYRDFRLDRFLAINGLTPNSTLRPG